MYFFDARTQALSNGDYPDYLSAVVRRVRRRFYIEQFVIDARPEHDEHGEILGLLVAIGEIAQRGVEVRIMLPDVQAGGVPKIDVNEPAAQFLLKRGVLARRSPGESEGKQPSHAKYVVADGHLTLVGSPNWTASSFRLNEESAMAVSSLSYAIWTEQRFLRRWENGSEYVAI